jgi:predicted TIM-barrel fold metal-dependent hydrolase
MLIADAQVHIWAANTPEHPWPVRNPPHQPHHGWPSFTADKLLREMDAAGVQRVVIVPPSWQGESNHAALEAARSHPDRFAVMGRLDLTAPGAKDEIKNWRKQPGMLGMRFTFTRGQDPNTEWLWQEMAAHGIPAMTAFQVDKLHMAGDIAQRHPKLKLVIDHLGIPTGSIDEGAVAHFDTLIALAKHPNIAVKASSLPKFTSDQYPFRWFHPYLRRVYDAFGPKRMFWGSDMTSLACPYKQVVTMFTEEILWLSATDKEWIMGRGLCEWLGWPLPK